MRILIVEDEKKTAAYVRKGLTEQGYAVDVAHEGLDGLHLATTTNYDPILLDVLLPGIDGWAVLQSIREQRQTPVLFLGALDKVDDRVKGLNLGADDYLVKAFAFSELLARIQNILRRGPVQRETASRIADLEIDPVRHRVTRGGDRIDLTAKEYALLDYLTRHIGEMRSRVDASTGCTISVSNVGAAIPADVQTRIFERFYRGVASRENSSSSSGLGLAIVRSIMDLHQGTVSVHSGEDSPTVFTLAFPKRLIEATTP